jgi:Mg2+/Co2+ transporter CorB
LNDRRAAHGTFTAGRRGTPPGVCGSTIVESNALIPEPNEIIEAQGCRVTVLKTDRRRVTLAHIEKIRPDEEAES